MTALSVLTIVRNRQAHLDQLVEGLRRSDRRPDEFVVVDMSDAPLAIADAGFPTRVERIDGSALPLAAARNAAAGLASFDHLLFLDVDCIPLAGCLARLGAVLDDEDSLLCADIRYLGPGDAAPGWSEPALLAKGSAHPARSFPSEGVRREDNPGLFWSLGFAIRRATFQALGGFDEGFVGYGAEDTDFGVRAAHARLPLLFVGGAIACHQYHDSHEPPVQHLADIVRNARRFRALHGWWPMPGWLEAFVGMGLIAWTDAAIEILRLPTEAERRATLVRPAAVVALA